VRVLLAGGGCRGLILTRGLTADGHAVRVVARDESRRAEIEAAGGECWIGDPDRIGSIRYALENVTVVVWALGTATGDPEKVQALHGSRLTMLLERTIDTTARGFVYEAAGTVGAEAFARGTAEVQRMCRLNEVPYALLDTDPADGDAWAGAARAAIDELLARDRG
jgi:hypothetical protein